MSVKTSASEVEHGRIHGDVATSMSHHKAENRRLVTGSTTTAYDNHAMCSNL